MNNIDLVAATERNEQFGIWGGISADRLRRRSGRGVQHARSFVTRGNASGRAAPG
jgi:hypothetical protein